MLEQLRQILVWFREGADRKLREENEKLKAELEAIKSIVDEIYGYIA